MSNSTSSPLLVQGHNYRYSAVTICTFSIALASLYFVSLKWLIELWLTDRTYSHGFLIPIISIYLIWLKRDILPNIKVRPAPIVGIICIVFSFILLFIGRAGFFVQLEALSFLLILPSIVLFTLGWNYLKALALPLFYLQFMVPLMDPILDRIHLPFQLISAQLGSFFLRLIGYPVFLDTVYIHLPNISLEVAQACSGISFFITVIAIGLALVYLTQKTWTRAAIVLTSGVFIVVLANGIRVALAGVMGQCYGPEMLHGPAHIFHGWFVAQVGLVGIFLVNWWVTKWKSPIESRLFERGAINVSYVEDIGSNLHVSRKPTLILLVVLFVFSGYLHLFAAPIAVQPRTSLPYRLGEWHGSDDNWIDSESYFPGAIQIVRTYTNQEGHEIKVLIPYYSSQGVDKRLISYLSRSLYNGGEIYETGLKRPALVNRIAADIDKTRYDTLFWFRLPSGDYTASFEVKIRSIRDALFRHQNFGAFVLLAAPIHDQSDKSGVSKIDLQSFIEAIAPEIDAYAP